MPWYHAVAERDHVIMDPTTPEKIRELGARLGLGAGSHVLDMACGKCGPAIVLAETFGCRITGVEKAAVFAEAGRARVAAAGLSGLVEVHEADGAGFPLAADGYDAALCLGASWIWDGLPGTLAALTRAARRGGHVVVGEPYWRRPPPRDHPEPSEGFVSLAETVGRFEAAGLAAVALIDASLDDWDRYESMHWAAVEDWLAENPADAEAAELRELNERYRQLYLRWNRDLLGWAILAGAEDVTFTYEWRGAFENAELNALHAEGFEHRLLGDDWRTLVERHSLGWVCAREADELVGFVNVAWDGAVHAFVLDTLVTARVRRQGVGVTLVATAVTEARAAGCEWLHVDFEDHLRGFYFDACGFVPTNAGLIALRTSP